MARVRGGNGVHGKTMGLLFGGGKGGHLVDLGGSLGHLSGGGLLIERPVFSGTNNNSARGLFLEELHLLMIKYVPKKAMLRLGLRRPGLYIKSICYKLLLSQLV